MILPIEVIRKNILYLFLLTTVAGYSQKKINLATANTFIVEFEDKQYEEPIKIDFSGIIVKDFRFDTTKIGYTNRIPKKIVFNSGSSEGFTASLNQYFNNIFNPNSEKKLVIIIKNFWLRQDMAQEDKKNKIEEMSFDPATPGKCYANLEIFSQSGSNYKALLQIKNEFGLSSYKRMKLDAMFFVAFDSMISKVSAMNVEEVLSKKKDFTWADINNNYNKRFDLPVLATKETKRGVFMTFEDFRQNNTIHPNFKKREGKLTDELYNDGDDLITDFWGFFDGQDYYIKIGYSFFKMVRQNNTFDLMGAKKVTRETTYYNTYPAYANPNTPGTAIPVSRRVLDLKPLQLNMETGEVY
jgi:hypothetical protein